MKRCLGAILILNLSLFSTVACAQQASGGSKGYSNPYTTVLKPDKKYSVRFLSGSSIKVAGRDLILTEHHVGIRLADTGSYRYYDRSQIKDITRGSHWALGLGIGAGGGALLGGLIGYGATQTYSCAPPNSTESCRMGKVFVPLIGTIAGFVVGSGVGAGVGAAIPKKVKFTVSPTVMSAPGRPVAGGGVGIAGRF